MNKNKKPWHGTGIAAGTWITNSMPGSVQLKLNEDGTITVVTAATDNGSGAVTMGVTQIVAEHFGLSADDIIVTMPDTDVAGYDGGSQGSRTTHIVGRAAGIAADELKGMIFDVASGLLEAGRDDLEMIDGTVGVVGYPDSPHTPGKYCNGYNMEPRSVIRKRKLYNRARPIQSRLCQRHAVSLFPDAYIPRSSRRS